MQRRSDLRILTTAGCAMLLLLTACATERGKLVTLRGKPMTLQGRGVAVGQTAPDFTAVNQAMRDKNLSDYHGKTVILSSVPSLDTPVCDLQTRTFNEKAAALGENIVILTISMDLPMAQKRWCGARDVTQLETLSDYKYHRFAKSFGLRIAENGLLARAIYVINPHGVIIYEQIVPELASEPDYNAAIQSAKQAAADS